MSRGNTEHRTPSTDTYHRAQRKREGMHNYRKMKIYERALALTVQVYRLTGTLPREEEFGLRSQLRRAAVSVCLNIAEGSGASSNREFGRFLDIARRSAYELNACFQVCTRLG